MLSKKFILFGAGYEGKRILSVLGRESVECFCDNHCAGKVINDIRVISFENLKSVWKGKVVVLSVQNPDAVLEMSGQLEAAGISYLTIKELMVSLNLDFTEQKYEGEMYFWKNAMKDNSREKTNGYYRKFILAIANEENDDFLSGKIVADFGCGPRGTLTWTEKPEIKLGIDVLVPNYLKEFGTEMINHRMIYVACNENYIPIPSESVDCLITMNSLDHVDSVSEMCGEVVRVMKPGAILLGSFNLYEPETACEPQSLNEQILFDNLLNHFAIDKIRYAYMDGENAYSNMFQGDLVDKPDGKKPCVMWVRATKKAEN